MAIPKEILAVERPKNTVVYVYGKNRDRYGVKERIGCRRVGGRNVPVNGATVGHIVGGRFVPIGASPAPLSSREADVVEWAGAELLMRICPDVLEDLRKRFCEADAARVFCVAALRVLCPGVADGGLEWAYRTSSLRGMLPGLALSGPSVSRLLTRLGAAAGEAAAFMRDRVRRLGGESRVLLDGTVKHDNSRVNSLSDFSRKGRVSGRAEVSLIYAFDVAKGEPICFWAYPGNTVDAAAYPDFLEKNGIKSGLIVADKGFPRSSAESHFESNPALHYLSPLRRNSSLISGNGMLRFEGTLAKYPTVQFKKKGLPDGRCLYSFRDANKAAKEERDFLKRQAKGYADCSPSKYEERRDSFGTVVFESDLDWDPAEIYFAYSQRWLIEVVMRYYKVSNGLDDTRVHSDLSVMGSEFVNFLSTLMTFRLIREFGRKGLLEKATYGEIMKDLSRSKRVTIEGATYETKVTAEAAKRLETLGLVEAEEKPKRKRGRPKKSAI